MKRRKLKSKTGYKFTDSDDWFSRNLPEWRELLLSLNRKPCRLLEIGSYEGRSSFWMVDNLLSHRDSSLTCVDSWTIDRDWAREGEKHFKKNLAICPRKKQVIV